MNNHLKIFNLSELKQIKNWEKYSHIIDYIENNTETFLQSTQQELIDKIYISQPTLSRFSKKMGYKNFKELQLFVAEKFKNINPEINLELKEEKNIYDVMLNVFNQYNNLAKLILNSTSDFELKKLSEDIYKCRNTIIFGIGTNGYLGKYFQKQVRKFGISVIVINSIHDFFDCLNYYDNDSHFILISKNFENKEILHCAKMLNQNKISFSIISRNQNLQDLKPKNYLTYNFFAKKSFEFDISNKICVLMIFDIIYFYIVSQKDPELLSLKKSKKMVSQWNKLS